jgi:hypothetical protein
LDGKHPALHKLEPEANLQGCSASLGHCRRNHLALLEARSISRSVSRPSFQCNAGELNAARYALPASTTIPEVEEDSELLTLNGTQVINVKTHRHRRNRKPKNPVSQLKHFKIRGEPTKDSLEKMTDRDRIQLKDASAKGDHQPEGRPQTGASRTN